MTTTKTKQKPLKEIIKRLREEANDDLQAWIDSTWYHPKVQPPDLLAVLDQIKDVSDLSPGVESPMMRLLAIGHIFSNSNDTEKAAIGYTLIQCHEEISILTKFCRDLGDRTVDYPIQDTKDNPE